MIAAGGTVFVPASCPRSPRILPRGIADPSSASGLPGTGYSDIAVGVPSRALEASGLERVLRSGELVLVLACAVVLAVLPKDVCGHSDADGPAGIRKVVAPAEKPQQHGQEPNDACHQPPRGNQPAPADLHRQSETRAYQHGGDDGSPPER